MNWISVKDIKPTKKDSPILACKAGEFGFQVAALEYVDDGWDGAGWYDHSAEYGMGLNVGEAHFHEYGGMTHWMRLPKPPEE